MADYYDQSIEEYVRLESGPGSEMNKTEVIVKFNGDIRTLGAELSVQVEDLGMGYAIVTLDPVLLPRLYDFREIEYIELPRTLSLMLSDSLRAACILTVQSPNTYGLSGKNVLVGVIDSGIDYSHPDFRNEDGTTRILYLWDQTESGRPPYGFIAGAEYSGEEINSALENPNPLAIVPSRDTVGHGTAVAGIAAGNGRASGGSDRGAAPEASLIIVKLGFRGFGSFARTTEIMRAIKYIIDRAEYLGMPVAINLSFGTNDGSHDGSSLFETYISGAAQRWKTVVVAATGNEGAARHHYSDKIRTGETVTVAFSVGELLSDLHLSLWKNSVDTMSIELILPSGRSTGVINSTNQLYEMTIDNTIIQAYFGQPTHYRTDQEIYFRMRSSENAIPQGIWQLRVIGGSIVDGRFDIWLPTLEEVGANTAFTRPALDTTLTLPSTVENVISVGGYNAVINSAAQFSGRGFNRNNSEIKPDIVAPAVGIIAPRTGGGYDSYTGTSMAAAFVSGSAALMMQWGIAEGNDPFLYGQRVKAFLIKGAMRSEMLTYPNQIWGYGRLCLRNSMDYLSGLII